MRSQTAFSYAQRTRHGVPHDGTVRRTAGKAMGADLSHASASSWASTRETSSGCVYGQPGSRKGHVRRLVRLTCQNRQGMASAPCHVRLIREARLIVPSKLPRHPKRTSLGLGSLLGWHCSSSRKALLCHARSLSKTSRPRHGPAQGVGPASAATGLPGTSSGSPAFVPAGREDGDVLAEDVLAGQGSTPAMNRATAPGREPSRARARAR